MSDETKAVGFKKKKNKSLQLKTNHILAIGIDKYQYQTSLQNPVDDCKKIIKILCEQYRFEEENVKTLFDKKATRDNILDALEEYERLTKEDNLLILFSGHGHYKKKGDAGFWIPTNAKKRSQYISNEDIKEHIRACQAHHIALIVDSCFSGAITRKTNAESTQKKNHLAAIRSYKRKSCWAMTSGRVELVYDGNAGENSPFARGLISELENNDKGMLLFSELGLAVRHIANRNADQDPSCSYLRDVGDMNGEFSFVLKGFEPMENTEDMISGDSKQVDPVPVNAKEIKEEPVPQLEGLDDIKKQLRQWVIEDELKTAYQFLVDNLNEKSSLKSTVYNRMGGWNRLLKEIVDGLAVNVAQQRAEHRNALGWVLDKIKEEDLEK